MKRNFILLLTAIILGVAVIFFMIFFLQSNLIMRQTESKSKAANYIDSGHIKDDVVYEQVFSPEYPFLEGVSIQINRDSTFQKGNEGEVTLSIMDDNENLIVDNKSFTKDITNKDYYRFDLDCSLEPGKEYSFVVQVTGCESEGPTIRYGIPYDIGLKENKTVRYAGSDLNEASTVCIYHYKYPISPEDMISYIALFLFFGSVFYLWGYRRYVILK